MSAFYARDVASAAADGDHDFEGVAVLQRGFTVAAPRHDVAIALDGDALPGERKRVNEIGDGRAGRDGASRPVHVDLDGRCDGRGWVHVYDAITLPPPGDTVTCEVRGD